jgi:hypothetical protein
MQITELSQTIVRNIFHTANKGLDILDHQICVCVYSPWPDAKTDRYVREMMTGFTSCVLETVPAIAVD